MPILMCILINGRLKTSVSVCTTYIINVLQMQITKWMLQVALFLMHKKYSICGVFLWTSPVSLYVLVHSHGPSGLCLNEPLQKKGENGIKLGIKMARKGKGWKCHQNPPIWAPSVKRGQNAIKIRLYGPNRSKRGKMPSKFALMGPISKKGGKIPSKSAYMSTIRQNWAKCHHNMPIWTQ